jgi:hypothetical protein
MCAVGVENQVHLPPARNATVNLCEELHKLLVPMSRLALANDRSIQNIQSSEQGRRSISLIVMCLAFGYARPHWQQRLRSVERLDLTFLITLSTSALSGGFRYRPTTSRSFSVNWGSLLSLNFSTRCGWSDVP